MFYKNKKIIIVYIFFLVSWLGFIFSNSLSTGSKSEEQSNKIVDISQKIVSYFDEDATVSPSAVRTSAHFLEFFILGLIYSFGAFFYSKNKMMSVFSVLSVSLFTAVFDETLQLGVEGRAAEVIDVWIDFSGSLLSTLLFFATLYMLKVKKNKKVTK